MPSYQATVRTPWPVDKAFEYMADLSNFDEWDPATKRADLVEGTPGKQGAAYDLTIGGKTLRYTVTEVEPKARVVAEAKTKSVRSLDTITVEPDGDGSLVTYDADLQPLGVARLLGPFASVVFHGMSRISAEGLAEQLEGQLIDAG